MNDHKESIIVEADTFDEFKNEASIVTAVKEQIEAAQEASSLNSVPGVQPLLTDPNRDTFLDWISAFLKPNQPSSPVLPIGDPPENCPPCGKFMETIQYPQLTTTSLTECGIPNKTKRIVGGVEAEVLRYPWMAVLMYGGRFYCGGALISDRYVLTAAHCLKGFNFKLITIKFLEHDMKDNSETNAFNRSVRSRNKVLLCATFTFVLFHQILGYKIHKLYSSSNYNCDIGLIKLSEPVDTTKLPLNPVCLAEKHKAFIKEKSVVAGWGATSEGGSLSNKLLQVEVPVWSNAECKMSGYGKNRITDNMLCAGFKEGGKDACQGE